MGAYFYIVPLAETDYFKIGISRGSLQQLRNRVAAHRTGFKNSGFSIDEKAVEYIEFGSDKYAGFLEYHLLHEFESSPVCKYGGTEIFHSNKLFEIRQIAAKFSDDFKGSGFLNYLSTNPKAVKQPRRILTEEQKAERRLQIVKRAEENRQRENSESFQAFAKWFNTYSDYITVRPFANLCVALDYFVLDVDLSTLPAGYRGNLVWWSELFYSKKASTFSYLRFAFEMTAYSYEGNLGQFYFRKDAFHELKIIDPDCWELLPDRIKSIFSQLNHEIIEQWNLTDSLPEELWSKHDRLRYEKLNREQWEYWKKEEKDAKQLPVDFTPF